MARFKRATYRFDRDNTRFVLTHDHDNLMTKMIVLLLRCENTILP